MEKQVAASTARGGRGGRFMRHVIRYTNVVRSIVQWATPYDLCQKTSHRKRQTAGVCLRRLIESCQPHRGCIKEGPSIGVCMESRAPLRYSVRVSVSYVHYMAHGPKNWGGPRLLNISPSFRIADHELMAAIRPRVVKRVWGRCNMAFHFPEGQQPGLK